MRNRIALVDHGVNVVFDNTIEDAERELMPTDADAQGDEPHGEPAASAD